MKKYELQPTDLTTPDGKPLFQVVALRDFNSILKGDKGGYIESEANLSHNGDCWVSGNARVFSDARVSGNARVFGNAQVAGNSWVFNDAWVYGDAHVYGYAWVFDSARVSGNARVHGDAEVSGDALVYGAACNHDNCPKCGEEPTEERKFSDLETEVEHSDISASATSDTLPEYGCNSDFHDAPAEVMNRIEIFFCAKCGEKL